MAVNWTSKGGQDVSGQGVYAQLFNAGTTTTTTSTPLKTPQLPQP